MTNTDAHTPIGNDCRVRLTVFPGRQADDRWQKQLELLKRAGADFADGSWDLWLDQPELSAPHLEPLWQAMLEYGTTVRITAITPASQADPGT